MSLELNVPGTYMVQLVTGRQVITKKLVVLH
ncbi:MAG: T9SS type A sorting domain-containing protein [Ferruginibacter sp.]|nr:T9SS type A sorting domain-containing protein [Ferruginibacter sp.]